MENNDKQNADHEKVKNWLQNIVKLPQYFDIFIENGFDTLHIIKHVTANDLTTIGIDKLGHKIQITQEIIKLNNQNNNNQNVLQYEEIQLIYKYTFFLLFIFRCQIIIALNMILIPMPSCCLTRNAPISNIKRIISGTKRNHRQKYFLKIRRLNKVDQICDINKFYKLHKHNW